MRRRLGEDEEEGVFVAMVRDGRERERRRMLVCARLAVLDERQGIIPDSMKWYGITRRRSSLDKLIQVTICRYPTLSPMG